MDELGRVGTQAYSQAAICNKPYIAPSWSCCPKTDSVYDSPPVQANRHTKEDKEEELRGNLNI
eukprot:15298181-Ditylum_brightwellii.AAC.2